MRIYKDFIQRYSELISAILAHESDCDGTVCFRLLISFAPCSPCLGRLFRRSIERMQPEIAHVPMNLHLQQLLVSTGDDPSQSRTREQRSALPSLSANVSIAYLKNRSTIR